MADQTIPADFQALIFEAMAEASRAMVKFPQPNYTISKFAEESGEVVKAAIHHAEGRETRDAVVSEMRQTIAMMLRLWIEGDQVHGMSPLRGTSDAGQEAPADPTPIISPDPITAAAQTMLDNANNFMGGRPYDRAMQQRIARAAIYGAAAYEAAPCPDSGTYALLRSFCLALIDPLHPDLDYLRADPAAGAKAREANNG